MKALVCGQPLLICTAGPWDAELSSRRFLLVNSHRNTNLEKG